MVNHSYGGVPTNGVVPPPPRGVAELGHCLGFPPAAGPSPVGRRSLRLFDLDAGLDRRVGGDINHRTNCDGGGAPRTHQTARSSGSDFSPLPGLGCRKRRAANKNTPQLERKMRLHSAPTPVRAKHFVAFAPLTGVQLGGSASRASARSHVPTLKASPQQRQGST